MDPLFHSYIIKYLIHVSTGKTINLVLWWNYQMEQKEFHPNIEWNSDFS